MDTGTRSSSVAAFDSCPTGPHGRRRAWRVLLLAVSTLFAVVSFAGDGTPHGIDDPPFDPIHRDGFEAIPAGTLDLSSLQPRPGMILAADAVPTISASFLPFAGNTIPPVAIRINGVLQPAPTVTANHFALELTAPLPEGGQQIDVSIGTGPTPTSGTWHFTTRTSPAIGGLQPYYVVLPLGTPATLGATFDDVGVGIDIDSATIQLDGVDISAGAGVTANGIQSTRVMDVPGERRVRVTVADEAGNARQADWVFHVGATPTIQFLLPAANTPLAPQTPIVLDATVDGIGQRLDATAVRVYRDGINVTPDVTAVIAPDGLTARLQATFDGLPLGTHSFQVDVRTESGVPGSASRFVEVEMPEFHAVALPGIDGTTVQTSPLDVTAEILTTADRPLQVSIQGIPARFVRVRGDAMDFSATVPLTPGPNLLVAEATFPGGQSRTASATVTLDAPPVLSIESPLDFALFGPLPTGPGNATQLTGTVARPVVVEGRSSRRLDSIVVNQQAGTLDPTGMRFRFDNFFLREGTNVLTAVGTDELGRRASASITVYVDQTAPIINVQSPTPEQSTSDAIVDVTGMAHDVVSPLVATGPITVVVRNLTSGNEHPGVVASRQFLISGVPLVVGLNRLEVVATDAAGNRRSVALDLVRTLAGAARIVSLDGNHQTAEVAATLPDPISVIAIDAGGNPVAGIPVHFRVLRGSGHLATSEDGSGAGRLVIVMTDVEGRAMAHATLGGASGPSSNQFEASSPSLPGEVVFVAEATPTSAHRILADGLGSTQYLAAGSTSIEPLTVTVYDQHHNRLPDTEVVYRIRSGMGRLLPAPSALISQDGLEAQVTTDLEGVASLRVLADPTSEQPIRVDAELQDASSAPDAVRTARFDLIVRAPGSGPTRFSGVVLDHSGQPLPGVRISIERTPLSVMTDQAGRFVFEDQVPAGKIDLHIDGRLADAGPGQQYPGLHFEAVVVPGRDNQLPHLIYLPPADLTSAAVVGGADDVTLTVPGWEGLSMRVRAGSVTFPDGARTGPLTVSMVHADRLPMVPQGGSSGFGTVGWTIQPSGTRFDPPIEVTLPNTTGMAPGATLTILQWDHDLATFVPMGHGVVSEDGSRIVTEAGTGISKAGWGGGPPPVPPNDGDNPPSCPVRVPAGEDCPCTVSNLQGSCIAKYDEAESYTVDSPTPDKITWSSGPNGLPATGTGLGFDVTFGRMGTKYTYKTRVDAFCPETPTAPVGKEIGVAAACSVYEPMEHEPVFDSGVATSTASAHAKWGATVSPHYPVRGCITDGNQWTHRVDEIETKYNIIVNQTAGLTYLTGPDDPQITNDNCRAVLRDLTPTNAGSPYPWPIAPYDDYVPQALVIAHEEFHQSDFVEKILDPFVTSVEGRAQNFPSTECMQENPYQAERAWAEPEIERLIRQFCGGNCSGSNAAHEQRAYVDEARRLGYWTDAIRARAVAENWRQSCR